jgi:ribonucleoside-diphosphate reductase alpha chain
MQTDVSIEEQSRPDAAGAAPESAVTAAEVAATAPGQHHVIRRNGKVTAFDDAKIKVAITKAFLAVEGGNAAASRRIHDIVDELTAQVADNLFRRAGGSSATVHIEDIQDQVELALMRGGHHKVARAYVLYREQQAQKRAAEAATKKPGKKAETPVIHVTRADGTRVPLDEAAWRRWWPRPARGSRPWTAG